MLLAFWICIILIILNDVSYPKIHNNKNIMEEKRKKHSNLDYFLGKENIDDSINASAENLQKELNTIKNSIRNFGIFLSILITLIYYNIETRFKAFDEKINMKFEIIQTQINSEFEIQNTEIKSVKEDLKEIKDILKSKKK